ncbi:class I SAM-dependent methyltransferase [Candidatus Puniceispirillum sp.]|nr:class I SAM-dependent methyltransferase [Alphaproteobacteria bacterium]MDC1293897.1 class I SAM-dependent methyltransferase [Candidatus Puniceispirillum sp.]
MKADDIRPKQSMIKQRVALANDIAFFETHSRSFVDVDCPACGKKNDKFLYIKSGLQHNLCLDCDTQFISPRPDVGTLSAFYAQSENYSYWADEIFKNSASKRMDKIFIPRAKFIKDQMLKRGVEARSLLEIGAAYGFFCDATTEVLNLESIFCIEPTPKLANVLREKGYETIEDSYENVVLSKQFSLVAAFEVIEHLFNPSQFLNWAYNSLFDSGLLYITCPNILGFETQMLGRESETIDHEHLNLFSPTGMKILLEESGFCNVEITTPGKLDTDIVWEYFKACPPIGQSPANFMFKHMLASDSGRLLVQNLLEELHLSTHMSIVAEKAPK